MKQTTLYHAIETSIFCSQLWTLMHSGLIRHNNYSEKTSATLFTEAVNFDDNKFVISLAFHYRPTNNERFILSKFAMIFRNTFI